MNFGLCLLVKKRNEGLNRNEINGLLAMMEGDSYYPIEFCNKNTYAAMGFISSGVASSIDYNYNELHNFVAEILTGAKAQSKECRYTFKNINIWICFNNCNPDDKTEESDGIMEEKIKEATFTSVWDDGVGITTKCKVNIGTKEVYDIESAEVSNVEVLEEEYVTIDGVNYPVSPNGEGGTVYWYE